MNDWNHNGKIDSGDYMMDYHVFSESQSGGSKGSGGKNNGGSNGTGCLIVLFIICVILSALSH